VIVGPQTDEPNFVQELKRIAVELGVSNDVDFRERISDEELVDLYHRASIFMLTSVNKGHNFEGFGLVFLEAGACGLPSIGTRGNGIEDAIIEEKTGILVPQRDVGATADAIRRLLRDPQLRSSFGANARVHAIERSWQVVVKEYVDVYRSITT
jgi:phosphatidyl-myo-inositol dimannoside synthase